MENLDELRREMANLDRQILALVGRRLEHSRLIGEAKAREGLPVRNFQVEVEVMSRARRLAGEFGFDARIAEQVTEILVSAAVQTQIEQQVRPDPSGHKRILVAGGCGRMGSWLMGFFTSQGHSVYACDPHSQGSESYRSLAEARAQEAWDVVVLSTPLGTLAETLQEALEFPGNPLIFDIASLKKPIVERLRRAAQEGRRVSSIHPMFAPGLQLLHGRTVLVCDAGHRAATDEAKELFRGTAVGLFEIPLEEHDRYMAALLGLSHAVNLIFGGALRRLGLPFTSLGQVASTTFAKQSTTAAEVAAENPVLYHEIQNLNPYSEEVYGHIGAALAELREASLKPDSSDFLASMQASRHYFFPA